MASNRCLLFRIDEFLEAVHIETKEAKYRMAAARSLENLAQDVCIHVK